MATLQCPRSSPNSTTAFRAAITAAFGLDADPLVGAAQNEKFGDYQANAAMGLAKAGRREDRPKDQPPRRRRADQGEAGPGRDGPGGHHRRAGVHQRAALAGVAGRAAAKARRRRPALGIEKADIAADRRRRLFRPERRQADARRPPAQHDHRRRDQPGAGIPGRPRHPPEPHRRLGDAVRDADRQLWPASRPGRAAESTDLEEFYRQAKKRFDDDPAFQKRPRADRRAAARRRRRASCRSGRQIVEETRRIISRSTSGWASCSRPSTSAANRSTTPRLPAVVADLKAAGIAVESDGAIAVFIDGPDKRPLIIEKTGGGYLYGTTDLAAIRYRVASCTPTRIIYIHDSRQAQHFAQVFATAKKAGWADGVSLEYAAVRHDARRGRQAVQDPHRRDREAEGPARRGRGTGVRGGDGEEPRPAARRSGGRSPTPSASAA